MPLSTIRKKALEKLTGLMTSDRAMQLMADPRAQKLMMTAFRVQAQISGTVNRTVAIAAKQLNLATRKDISELKRKVRSLENQLKKVQNTAGPPKPKEKK